MSAPRARTPCRTGPSTVHVSQGAVSGPGDRWEARGGSPAETARAAGTSSVSEGRQSARGRRAGQRLESTKPPGRQASGPGAGGAKFSLIRPELRRWLSRRRPATRTTSRTPGVLSGPPVSRSKSSRIRDIPVCRPTATSSAPCTAAFTGLVRAHLRVREGIVRRKGARPPSAVATDSRADMMTPHPLGSAPRDATISGPRSS